MSVEDAKLVLSGLHAMLLDWGYVLSKLYLVRHERIIVTQWLLYYDEAVNCQLVTISHTEVVVKIPTYSMRTIN